MTCPGCQSENVYRAKNDCGHYKPERGKPIRKYEYRCEDCGLISVYALTAEQEAKRDA